MILKLKPTIDSSDVTSESDFKFHFLFVMVRSPAFLLLMTLAISRKLTALVFWAADAIEPPIPRSADSSLWKTSQVRPAKGRTSPHAPAAHFPD
jgi:hypothetical protein